MYTGLALEAVVPNVFVQPQVHSQDLQNLRKTNNIHDRLYIIVYNFSFSLFISSPQEF